MRKNTKNIFTGVMDLDKEPKFIEKGDYVEASGIQNSIGAETGVIETIRGNSELVATLPLGDNTCIGSYEHKQSKYLYYFIFNSLNNHSIWRISFGGTPEKLVESSVLSFNTNWKIHSVHIVGDFLYWTDGRLVNEEIVGNPPRKLYLKKVGNSQYEYELVITEPLASQTLTLEIRDKDNNITAAAVGIYNSGGTPSLDAAISGITSALQSQGLTVTTCGKCSITVAVQNSTDDIVLNSSFTRQFSRNHYKRLSEIHIDYILWKPSFAPKARYTPSPNIFNNVDDKLVQFRYRYIYFGNKKSKFSPISNIPLDVGINGIKKFRLNAIQVDITNDILLDENLSADIKAVELAFREGNLGIFKSISVIPICELGLSPFTYDFVYDQLYTAVASDDDTSSGDVQVLSDFDRVPRISMAMGAVGDDQGLTRIFHAGVLERFNNPSCSDINFIIEDDPLDDDLVTIRGRVAVYDRDHSVLPLNTSYLSDDFSFPDMVLDGFVIYLAGTDYYAISDNPPDGTGTGEFFIQNVPKGVYVMRVASYKCRFTNDLGAIYNLNNSTLWQKTSSPLINMTSFLPRSTELFIDIRSVNGIFDTEPTNGIIQIENFRWGQNTYGQYENYLLDTSTDIDWEDENPADGWDGAVINTDPNILKSGAPVESQAHFPQIFQTTATGALTIDEAVWYSHGQDAGRNYLICDHNGYCYLTFKHTNGASPTLYNATLDYRYINSLSNSVDIDTFTPVLSYSDIFLDNFELSNPESRFVHDFITWVKDPDNKFRDDTKSFVQGFTKRLGLGLGNVLCGVLETSQFITTKESGFYKIPIYKKWSLPAPTGRNLTLLASYLSDIGYDNAPTTGASINNIYVNQIPLNYNRETPFIFPDIVFPNTVPTPDLRSCLKAGEKYNLAIEYFDRAGRKATALDSGSLYIPFHTESQTFGMKRIRFEINHNPPDWATSYQVLRSQGATYKSYLVTTADDVRYVVLDEVGLSVVDTLYEYSNATHILLKVPIVTELESGLILFRNNENKTGYVPQDQDRVRFIYNSGNNFINAGGITDSVVEGVFLDGTDYYVVIENPEISEEIFTGSLIELYGRNQSDDDIYYQCGTGGVIEGGFHVGSVQTQTSTLPAIGYIEGGDTYWRRKQFFSSIGSGNTGRVVENKSLSDNYESESEDIGSINIIDAEYQKAHNTDIIRFSGIYNPQTNLNGLSSFKALDYQAIDRRFGPIQKLCILDNIMLVICTLKSQSIYVGKDRLMDLSGSSRVGRSDRILNIANEFKREWGTHHPESVVIENGFVYAWDAYRGLVWRYSSNGQTRITVNTGKHFQDIGKIFLNEGFDLNNAYGGFDREFGVYLLTLNYNGQQKTYSFREQIETKRLSVGWNTLQPFTPEYYGLLGLRMYSFINGQIWVHNSNSVPICNFYGIQHSPYIKFVASPDFSSVKEYYNIQVTSSVAWEATTIETPITDHFPIGQLSSLNLNRFTNYEGKWCADFLRDKNDPKKEFLDINDIPERELRALLSGRELRGDYIIIKLTCLERDSISTLSNVDIEYMPSMHTK